jgi:hypothetical protein
VVVERECIITPVLDLAVKVVAINVCNDMPFNLDDFQDFSQQQGGWGEGVAAAVIHPSH